MYFLEAYYKPIFEKIIYDDSFELEIFIKKNKIIHSSLESINIRESEPKQFRFYVKEKFVEKEDIKAKIAKLIDRKIIVASTKHNGDVYYLLANSFLIEFIDEFKFNEAISWDYFFKYNVINLEESLILKYIKNISMFDLAESSNIVFTERIISEAMTTIPLRNLKESQISFTENVIEIIENRQPILENPSISFFEWLSERRNVYWSQRILEKYLHKWNWKALSSNETIIWTDNLLRRFNQYIDFEELSFNDSLQISKEVLLQYKDRWNWGGISGNSGIVSNWYLFEYLVKECKYTVWTIDWNEMVNDNENQIAEINYRDVHENVKREKLGAISTNAGIKWTSYLIKNFATKIDFWFYAQYGNWEGIILDDLIKVQESLGVNRFIGHKKERVSDWLDWRPIYRLGWENLFCNLTFKITDEILIYLKERTKGINFFRYEGDAHYGYDKTEYCKRILDAAQLNSNQLRIKPENLKLLPSYLFNYDKIDTKVFDSIIKPILLKDRYLLEAIVKRYITAR